MVSVLILNPFASSHWLWWALVVLAAGIGPLLCWRPEFVQYRLAQRFGLALIFALVLAVPTYAAVCPSCFGCDPWFLEWFWICVP